MCEYKIPKKMFDELLKTRRGEEERKLKPEEYVRKVINETFGLKETVTRVIVE